jgi:hypothetical protein
VCLRRDAARRLAPPMNLAGPMRTRRVPLPAPARPPPWSTSGRSVPRCVRKVRRPADHRGRGRALFLEALDRAGVLANRLRRCAQVLLPTGHVDSLFPVARSCCHRPSARHDRRTRRRAVRRSAAARAPRRRGYSARSRACNSRGDATSCSTSSSANAPNTSSAAGFEISVGFVTGCELPVADILDRPRETAVPAPPGTPSRLRNNFASRYNRLSGSTSTLHGDPGSPPSTASGSSPRRTTLNRQRPARRAT